MKILLKIIICINFLLSYENIFSQDYIRTCDIDNIPFYKNLTEKNSIIDYLPKYSVLEFLNYYQIENSNEGFFEVIYKNQIGFISRTHINYDSYYYGIDYLSKAKKIKKIEEKSLINNDNISIVDQENNTQKNEIKIDTTFIKNKPPKLVCKSIKFIDKNQILEGNERAFISYTIYNIGKGNAYNIQTKITNSNIVNGIEYSNPSDIKILKSNDSINLIVPILGNISLDNNFAKLIFNFSEHKGFQPDPFEVSIQTKAFEKPLIKVVDYSFTTENGKIEKGEAIVLKVLVQNVGQGIANNVELTFNHPTSNILPNSQNHFQFPTLLAGESKEVVFEFMSNKLYSEPTIPITINISEKHKRFAENKSVIATLNSNSSITSIKVVGHDDSHKIDIKEASLTSDVDKNIPKITKVNPHKYALIIGNEDYSSKQSGLSSESNVEYALNDAKVFYEYAINTLGIPKENCFLLLNATSGEMTQKINVITQILTRLGNSSELIFFYAGHGHPEENTKIPYLIPVDVSATNIQSAIKVTDLYAKFAQTKTNRITVFLDACFTGGGRDQGLIASRAVKVVPKADMMNGNMVRFSATSNEQSALPYKEKQHGMFTYFLLKKLQETKGQVSYQELSEYIKKQVALESLKINYKEQDPQVDVSRDVQDTWGSWRINE